jgi:ATP-dependent Clp protease ATP-binding subunit ClpC
MDAQEEARRFNSDQLLPEHIIISMLKEGVGTACKALKFLKIDLEEFRRTIEKEIPRMSGALVLGDVPLSKRTRTMMENAAEEARILGNDYIGTEHLLFASLREKNAPVPVFLGKKDIQSDMLRVIIQTTFNQHGPYPGDGEFYSFEEYQSRYLSRREDKRPGPAQSPRSKSSYQTGTPTLDEYSRDLTALARMGRLDPVIGRQNEIQRAVRILARRTKNNPVLIGEPGVGKTAIVEGLAVLLAGDDVPEALSGRRILSLDLGSVVAGTKYRGEFEERLKKIMKEIAHVGNVILFIDEIHTIIGAGGAEGTIDASNMLKPALSRGDIQCIGATTLSEYRRHFEKDAALERRFQTILVEEPDLADTLLILKGIQRRYEEHHRVRYTPEAVAAAAALAQRYISGRFMPDKAIDILDETGAMKKLENRSQPPEIEELESEIEQLTREKGDLVFAQDYESAAEVRDKVRSLKMHITAIREAWAHASRIEYSAVDERDVRKVVGEITGIPLIRLEEQESKRLLKIEEELHKSLVGQDEAVGRIASAIRRGRAGISSPNRPMGSFIFLGPTGVGKTLLAKRLAGYLFGAEDALVRIDMSDFMEKHNASRLVGAPPGYIGYEEGGMLTEKIRRNPYRVVLFDEIEKAHHDVFNLLLQVLEEGELKDNLDHTVSFRNTVIIMTSNAGVREISRDAKLGFTAGSGIMELEEIQSQALSELRRLFNPEFINRVDDVVVFHPLDHKQVERVLELQLDELSLRLAEHGFGLRASAGAKRLLIERGWDPKYGARPMRRTIQRELEDPISLLVLENGYAEGSVFVAESHREKIRIQVQPPASGSEAPRARTGVGKTINAV